MSDLQAWAGRHVQLELRYSSGEIETLELDIVKDEAADFDNGFLGESTPLAQAIQGKRAGDVVSYQAGDRVRVRILAVSEELAGTPEDLSDRREESLRKAVRQSEDTNAILFASSFSGKWGDYDPKAVKKDDEDEEQ